MTVQSSSNTTNVAPDDPFFEQTIQRDVALLQNRDGATIDRIMVTVVNTAGVAISVSETPVMEEIFVKAPKQDDASAAVLVRAKLDLAG